MYENFYKINGQHPWRETCPDGYVDYPVRYRPGGRVLYFNFVLAREMELIAPGHPARLTPGLEKAILDNFSLQIINEYEQRKNPLVMAEAVVGREYMATRYLQSQHKNKQGKTSGDGRSIWNGYIKTRTKTFDLSSRGTGATILSPGAVEAGRPLKTGSDRFGYASGLADVDEMLGSAIMSEIFYRERIPTERCLVVIDFEDGSAIGVRSAPNLIRPAHIFRYLKLGQWEGVKNSFDYFLQRQEENGVLDLPAGGRSRYTKSLEYLARIYARLAAVMEEEYIFNWLAWDGDNMLASGALLDYGSIRQFSSKHDKYRYEDVDRYSTCLREQRYWAKVQVKIFAQAVDFINTRRKKRLGEFEDHASLFIFDECFQEERQRRMLYRLGFDDAQSSRLMQRHQDKIQDFRRVLNYFEAMKISKGEHKLPDGIDHPPVFLVRNILRDLPKFLLRHWPADKQPAWPLMPAEKFCKIMAASYVNRRDLHLTPAREIRSRMFQQCYRALVEAAGETPLETLKVISSRSDVINYPYRKTGDGIIWIVEETLKVRKKMHRQQLQEAIDRFIESQVLVPGEWRPLSAREFSGRSRKSRHLRRIYKVMQLYSDDI